MNSETATIKQVAFEKDDVGNFSFPESHKFDAGYGLTKETVDYISKVKDEPDWVNEFRHKALKTFESKPMPTNWATRDLDNIDFDAIRYYLSDGAKPKRSWDEVPPEVLETFDRLGVPEQERAFLAGVEAQYDSEAAYSNVKEALADEGVIFVTCSEGLKEHEEIFRPWFGKVIPTGDNKFSALNSAVMSGGSFIYIPPGVKVKHPCRHTFVSILRTLVNLSGPLLLPMKVRK
jgi:Fe-S cluster assembly protein SufB